MELGWQQYPGKAMGLSLDIQFDRQRSDCTRQPAWGDADLALRTPAAKYRAFDGKLISR